jgi:hypothetical protein
VIEEYVPGREVTVGILDGRALGALEVVAKGEFHSYEVKYTAGREEFFMPARLSKATTARVLALADAAHAALGGGAYSRVDCGSTAAAVPHRAELAARAHRALVPAADRAARRHGLRRPLRGHPRSRHARRAGEPAMSRPRRASGGNRPGRAAGGRRAALDRELERLRLRASAARVAARPPSVARARSFERGRAASRRRRAARRRASTPRSRAIADTLLRGERDRGDARRSTSARDAARGGRLRPGVSLWRVDPARSRAGSSAALDPTLPGRAEFPAG